MPATMANTRSLSGVPVMSIHAAHCRDAVPGQDVPYSSQSARFPETLVPVVTSRGRAAQMLVSQTLGIGAATTAGHD
jgi:hypothetical protein